MKDSQFIDEKIIVRMQTDIALLKQSYEKIVEPTLRDINTKLDNLSYVTHGEFEEHRADIDQRFKEVRKRTWVQNTLSAIAGAVLTLLATYFIKDLLNK